MTSPLYCAPFKPHPNSEREAYKTLERIALHLGGRWAVDKGEWMDGGYAIADELGRRLHFDGIEAASSAESKIEACGGEPDGGWPLELNDRYQLQFSISLDASKPAEAWAQEIKSSFLSAYLEAYDLCMEGRN